MKSGRQATTMGRYIWRGVGIGTAFVAVALLSGCYQRTISARGIGASSYEISEPYQESGQLDEWIFGPPAGERRVTPLTRNGGRSDR